MSISALEHEPLSLKLALLNQHVLIANRIYPRLVHSHLVLVTNVVQIVFRVSCDLRMLVRLSALFEHLFMIFSDIVFVLSGIRVFVSTRRLILFVVFTNLTDTTLVEVLVSFVAASLSLNFPLFNQYSILISGNVGYFVTGRPHS